MARLLKIVGQEEIAGKIYIKNKQFDLAFKSFNMAFVRLIASSDDKAEKLIAWANIFKENFEFSIALDYCRKAYSCARTNIVRQKAVKLKYDIL